MCCEYCSQNPQVKLAATSLLRQELYGTRRFGEAQTPRIPVNWAYYTQRRLKQLFVLTALSASQRTKISRFISCSLKGCCGHEYASNQNCMNSRTEAEYEY